MPLVVAGVNDADVAAGEARGVVASPSGPVVPLALALGPIHREAGLERVVVTILHAASGAGRAGLRQLEKEMVALLNGEEPDASDLSHRMGFNLVPQVGAFDARRAAPTRRSPWARSCAACSPPRPWPPPPPPSASRSSTHTDSP